MGFEPGTFHLRDRRATNCAMRPDVHNPLIISAIWLYYVVDIEKYFALYCSHITFLSFWSLTNIDVCWLLSVHIM